MSKSQDNQWRKLIHKLDEERIDLRLVTHTRELLFDQYRLGHLSRYEYDSRLEECNRARDRIEVINGLVYSMIEAWQAGQDPVMWKLSRP